MSFFIGFLEREIPHGISLSKETMNRMLHTAMNVHALSQKLTGEN